LPILRAKQEKQLIEFVSLMSISFAGLYHYLGLILRGLEKEGVLIKKAAVPVYMGGNGARFMNWLDESGCFSKGCDGDELMEAVQSMSSGFISTDTGYATTTLSNAFKDETACGLISNGVNLKGIFDPRQDLMFAGERLAVNGSTYEVLDRVREPDEGSISRYELASADELKRFAQNYDDALRNLQITSLLPISRLATQANFWPNVETEIRANCLERIDCEFSDLEPEPPFITGLKALSRVLAREWAERY
jgi:hypothetical protein